MAGSSAADAALKAGAFGAGVGVAAFAAQGLVLATLGLSPTGPVAGSWAASMMGNIALSNGVGVTTGSWFAAAQSAAMGGAPILGGPVAVVGCATAFAAGRVGALWWSRKRHASDGAPGGCADDGAPGGGDGDGAPGGGDDIASATDLDEGSKGEVSSEENGTEGDQQSDELLTVTPAYGCRSERSPTLHLCV